MARTQSKSKIVFLDAGTLDYGDVDFSEIARLGPFRAYFSTPPEEIFSRAKGAEIIIANKTPLPARVLRKLRRLRLVCVAATGVNNVDLIAAKSLGIAITNVNAYSTDSVAEQALLFFLALNRRFLKQTNAVSRWSRSPFFCVTGAPFLELKGKVLGIIGYGAIGRKTAKLARAFGMKVLIAALPGNKYPAAPARTPFRTLLQKSDFVSLHAPLTIETSKLVGAKELALMKPTAFLVNVARGGLIDETALAAALKKRRIAGYASDVLSVEPPGLRHPLLAKSLKPLVLFTPHTAWASFEARIKLVRELAKNIRAFHNKKSRNRIV